MIDNMSFNPLSWGISDINPLSDLHFPTIHFKGGYALHEIRVETLDELVNSMFVLGEYF